MLSSYGKLVQNEAKKLKSAYEHCWMQLFIFFSYRSSFSYIEKKQRDDMSTQSTFLLKFFDHCIYVF
jgi:hypothetical protein